jgi:hypothetical protein
MTSDGVSWSVVKGCTEFTFSEEQLAQKREKYARRRTFTYVKDMGWLGWRAGFRTCCSHPFCETMLRLKVRGSGPHERLLLARLSRFKRPLPRFFRSSPAGNYDSGLAAARQVAFWRRGACAVRRGFSTFYGYEGAAHFFGAAHLTIPVHNIRLRSVLAHGAARVTRAGYPRPA